MSRSSAGKRAFLSLLAAIVVWALAWPRRVAAEPGPSAGAAFALRLVDLGPLWRVRPGVLADCGALDLDQTGFVTIDAYERTATASPAACSRATAEELEWRGQPLALSIGTLYAAAAVYVNGVLIATHGDVETGHGARRLRLAYVIPDSARRADGRLVIAVRAHVPPATYWTGRSGAFKGASFVGPRPLVEAEVRADDGSGPVLVGRMVVAAVFALLGAFHLVLYRKRKKLTEYLYWALAMLSFSGWMSYLILGNATDLPRDALEHLSALGYAVVAFALAGTWRLLRDDPMPRPLRVIVAVNVVLGVPQLLAVEAFGKVVPYALVMVVLLGGALAILGVTVREAWRGSLEARTVLLGMTLNVGFFAAEVAVVALDVPDIGLARVAYSGTEIGHVFFALSMALALANRFNRSLQALDAAHQELGHTYEAAARFVPTDLLRILGHQSIREVRLGDQLTHPMSTLFADVRGFSALAERVGPAQTFDIINRYLAFMEPAIHEHHGFILQYLGDGIMALFPGRADDAVGAGVAMHRALLRLNEERRGAGEAPLAIGIGVNTGTVMVGTIGGLERLDSGVVGDSVNLASRIEGMTKMYGAALLLGERTVLALEDRSAFALREVDRVVAKGTHHDLSIFEVLDALPEDPRAARERTLPRYAEALLALKRGAFVEARDGFAAVACEDPNDGAAAAMAQRAADLAAAPPAEWKGATQLLTK